MTELKRSGLFIYLLMLTAFFAFLEINFFIQRSGFYFADVTEVSAHLAVPIGIVPGIVFFAIAQCLVHLSYTVIIWITARQMGRTLRCSSQRTASIAFSLWVIGLITVLLANQYFFPNSQFADLTRTLIRTPYLPYVLVFFVSLCVLAVLVALRALVLPLFFVSAVFGYTLLHPQMPSVTDGSTQDKPNIILIGVDALRPDFLSYAGYSDLTPHLDNFLNQSAVFAEAMTPIARTFPSWVSILLGQYPKESGMRFDLANQATLDTSQALPIILKQHGYETLYAMDETRFSNMTSKFGFDQIITPPVGVNDFLLGTLNDLPLSNLIVNTPVGRWLFPYSYANRPAYITYNPNSFLRLIKPAIQQNRTKPLFLAIHFCLPHFPYFWASYSHLATPKALAHYQEAVRRVDQQIDDFLMLLKQSQVLNHSIVVLLSDHGEALELTGDRITGRKLFIPGADNKKGVVPHFYPPSFDFEKVNQSAGHGTDVLGFSQYHSVLAFRLYGVTTFQPALISGVVSLMDIKPTILDLLDIPHLAGSSVSLSPFILGKKKSTEALRQDFFMESDFSPEAVRSVHPETRRMVFEGIDFFEIDPVTTRLTVKKSMGEMIISSKQYADIHGSWVLALYPQLKRHMMPVLVNLQTGKWTNDLRTPFAKKSPAGPMLAAMRRFYGDEIGTVLNVPSVSTESFAQ